MIKTDELISLFQARCGYTPDIHNPKTFCEKVLRRKLTRDLRIPKYADKHYAKVLISGKTPVKPIPGYYGSAAPAFPFVMKPNNFSGQTRIINSEQDYLKAKHAFALLKGKVYGAEKGEWWYRLMPRIIMKEPMLEDTIELRFFCFSGQVYCILWTQFDTRKRSWFSAAGEFLHLKDDKFQMGRKELPSVIDLGLMVQCARTLSKDFDHVRTDLYWTPEGLYFGEFTFAHRSGMCRWSDPDFDRKLGEQWK